MTLVLTPPGFLSGSLLVGEIVIPSVARLDILHPLPKKVSINSTSTILTVRSRNTSSRKHSFNTHFSKLVSFISRQAIAVCMKLQLWNSVLNMGPPVILVRLKVQLSKEAPSISKSSKIQLFNEHLLNRILSYGLRNLFSKSVFIISVDSNFISDMHCTSEKLHPLIVQNSVDMSTMVDIEKSHFTKVHDLKVQSKMRPALKSHSRNLHLSKTRPFSCATEKLHRTYDMSSRPFLCPSENDASLKPTSSYVTERSRSLCCAVSIYI